MIKKIFLTDLKHLFHSFFALVIAIGVCFLPALYAWCNIYSNWDPYGNTGNLKVAAISLDEGWTDEDGEYENTGDDIIEELHDNDKIDWQFVETKKEAVQGVKSGEYYAALVVPKNFTYNMYNMFLEDIDRPELLFYQNQKKNPIATKITDTVVESLETKIDEKFVKVIMTEVFKGANDVADDIEEEGGIDGLIADLEELSRDIEGYEKMIDVALKGSATLSSAVTLAEDDIDTIMRKTADSEKSMEGAEEELGTAQTTLNDFAAQVDMTLNTIEITLGAMTETLEEAKLSGDLQDMRQAAEDTSGDITVLKNDLSALQEAVAQEEERQAEEAAENATRDAENNVTPPQVPDSAQDAINQAGNAAENAAANAIGQAYSEAAKQLNDTIDDMLSTLASAEIILDAVSQMNVNNRTFLDEMTDNNAETIREQMLKELSTTLTKLKKLQNQFNNELVPETNTCIDSLKLVLNSAEALMGQVGETLAGMGNVFGALEMTANSADISMEKTRDALDMLKGRVDEALEKVKKVRGDDRFDIIMDTLSGDPDRYGEFFAQPVEIETEAVYPVENYGAAVTPFYTVLAIWVGGIILMAVIKARPRAEAFPNARGYERFFGRYLIIFILAQLQTLVTVIGNFVIFNVQCEHPIYFWFAAAMTSLTFSLLIFALVYSFGDVGKAIAVVLVVLQIAGSSGTYPIEVLPDFFQKVYIFFPFPYGINAMREAMAGMYDHAYAIYLLQLSAFIVLAIAIGVWIQKPFARINHFMEERMEDTEMM